MPFVNAKSSQLLMLKFYIANTSIIRNALIKHLADMETNVLFADPLYNTKDRLSKSGRGHVFRGALEEDRE